MNLARTTTVNLIAIALVSTALIIYALATLLTGALLDDSYPLTVEVPETGGLIPQQEVTLSGVPVGLVDSFELDGEHVLVHMSIDEGRKIPKDVDVVILRRSAVGEQALDFRPHDDTGDEFFAANDVVRPSDVVTPVEVQRLLTLADKVFAPIDPTNAGKLVGELADIVRGRRDDIRSIISDSGEFSADIADNGEDYDTLFREGRKVTRALAANRRALATSLGDMADAAAVLSDMRTDFEGLLTDAPPVLSEVTSLANRANPNLSCVISDFASINEYMAQPRQMTNLEESLQVNQWFFVGFDIAAPRDHAGRVWNRLQFIPPQQPPAQSYLPAKRPIPDILPGGACTSPFGPGAGSAVQQGYTKRVPEARIIRPSDDRTEPVRVSATDSGGSGGGTGGTSSSTGDVQSRSRLAAGPAAGDPSLPATTLAMSAAPLPSSSSAGTLFGLGILVTAASVLASRRLRTPAAGREQTQEPS